jgi:hypothetical protein
MLRLRLALALFCIAGCAQIDLDSLPACSDGVDNDGDGLADFDDNGCSNTDDDDEADDPIVCGDGLRSGGELCDRADLGGESCVTRGFGGGVLVCNADCLSFDESQCDGALSAECADDQDNDQDGFVDAQDPACAFGDGDNEVAIADSCGGLGGPVQDVTFADLSRDVAITGATTGFTNLFAPTDPPCTQGDGPEVVLSYHVFNTTGLRISLNRPATDFDTVLYVRQFDCAGGVELCNDDISAQELRSELIINNMPPGDYFIFVDGFAADAVGDFELLIDLP